MNIYRIHNIVILFIIGLGSVFFTRPIQAEMLDSTVSTTETTQQSSEATEPASENEEVLIKNSTYAEQWLLVSTVSELQAALRNKEPYIKLADSAEVFDFGNTAIPITGDVTIDGNNRQISYDGGNLNGNKGLYSTTAGLTIRLQNMTFGSADFTVPAIGLYGIMQSETATQLHIENVNYYSRVSAQPFYLRNANSKIYFHGTNHFMQQKADGSMGNGQEFAECNNYEFASGSSTTIVQNTNDALGSLWMPGNPSSIILGEEAEVDITSNHNFIYSDGSNNGTITLEKNSRFSLNGTNKSKGDFYYFRRPAFLNVGEGAEFSINYPNSIKLGNNSAIKFMPDSVGDFTSTESESVFDRAVGVNSTFVIDNAKQLNFQGKIGSNYNPIGFAGGTGKFQFNMFQTGTAGYEILTDTQAVTPQRDAGTWTISTANISRDVFTNTPDFTTDEKARLKTTSWITLQRMAPPVELLKVDQIVEALNARFSLSEYRLNGNDNYLQGVDYKLFSKKTSEPNEEGPDFLTSQYTAGLDDEVYFDGLKEKTDYWLYVRIVCDPASQSSEWLEVPFTTPQEMINVSFPIEAAFHTKKADGQQKVTAADTYTIDNHSSFAVAINATDFQELSNPTGIQLLPEADGNNQKDLFLNLTEGNKNLGVLTQKLHESPLTFSDLAGNSSTTMGFSGQYYGDTAKAQQVQYQLTLTEARKD